MVGKRQRNGDAERKPHFFKVLLGDFSQRLKLPPSFLRHISKETSRRVTIQGPNDGIWHVEVDKSTNGTYLSAGWSEFVKDHSLMEHEFLVFRYNGDMHFSVQVFDTTACEREDLFTIEPGKNLKVCEGGSKQGKLAKPPFDASCHFEHQEYKKELPEVLEGDVASPNSNQGLHNAGSCKVSSSPNGNAKTEADAQGLPIHMAGSKAKYQGGYNSKRSPVTPEEISKACEAANSFHSVFPHVVVRMTVCCVHPPHALRFPSWFARTHLPCKKTNLILRDNERGWVVVYIPGQGSCVSALSGGWKAFAVRNNLKEGDFCVLELAGPVELRVHIFRAVEKTAPEVIDV